MAKIGYEVEGRFKGLKTLFVDIEELYLLNYQKIKKDYDISSVYISDLFSILNYEIYNFILLEIKIYIETVIIEVTKIKYPEMDIHFVLHVLNDSFFNLKDTDQVKFEKNLRVYSFTKESAMTTEPINFEDDITLTSEYYVEGDYYA